jgi:hypothetical protein
MTPADGTHAIELPAGTADGGYTSHTRNPDTQAYEDLGYVFRGGEIHVYASYMIPADAALTASTSTIRLEFRRTMDDTVYQTIDGPAVTGTTGGQWTFVHFVVPNDALGQFPDPPVNPYAKVSIVPVRTGGPDAAGTIFWDEFLAFQVQDCRADFNGDGTINVADFLAYLHAYGTGDMRADMNGCGCINVQSFLDFLRLYATACH